MLTNSSFICVASSCAAVRTARRRGDAPGRGAALGAGQRGQRGLRRPSASSAGSTPSLRSTSGTTPCGCASRAREQVFGLHLRVAGLFGRLLGGDDGFLRLFGEVGSVS